MSPVILLVEDNPADAELVRLCLERFDVDVELHEVSSGEQALDFIERNGDYRAAPRPDLILLDLNLPRVDGREVLRLVKSKPETRAIPVVVVTSSLAQRDLSGAYANHANAYVLKAVDFDEFRRSLRSMVDFWLVAVRLPDSSAVPLGV